MPTVGLTADQQRQYDDFLRRNPGDAHRAQSALGFAPQPQNVSTTQPQPPQPQPPVSTALPQPGRPQPQPTFQSTTSRQLAPNAPPGTPDNWNVPEPSLTSQYQGNVAAGWRDPADLAAANMIDRDRDSWEATLRAAAQAYGLPYDPGSLDGVIRHVSYARNAGRDPADFIRDAIDYYARRAAPTSHRTSDSQSGNYPDVGADPRTEPGYRAPASQPDLAALLPHLFGPRAGANTQPSPAPFAIPPAPPIPPIGQSYSYPSSFNQAAYQAYQAANPQAPMSPFEFAMGRQWTAADDAALAAGRTPEGVTPAAVQLYQSGGAQWPGTPQKPGTPPPGTPTGTPPPTTSTTPPPVPNLNPRGPNAGGPNPPRTTVPAQFDDPISSYIEQFAQRRAQDRENPPVDSGQALLEAALRDIAAQFMSGGYTPAEQEIYQTQAIDPIEQLRHARKQQVMLDLQRRGISPQSGVAIQMLQDVDRQFDAMRTQTQAALAGQFGQERVNRILQSVSMYGNLAGTENDRLNEAFQYRTVPLNLADRSFNQAFQMYNAAGNPLSLVNPLVQLGSLQQGRNDANQRAIADLVFAWMEAMR